MERRRPRGRDTGAMSGSYSGGTHKRGDGLGTGSVGSTGGSSGGGNDAKGILGNLAGQLLSGSGSSGGLFGTGSGTGSFGSGLGGLGGLGSSIGSGLGGLGSGLGQMLNHVGNAAMNGLGGTGSAHSQQTAHSAGQSQTSTGSGTNTGTNTQAGAGANVNQNQNVYTASAQGGSPGGPTGPTGGQSTYSGGYGTGGSGTAATRSRMGGSRLGLILLLVGAVIVAAIVFGTCAANNSGGMMSSSSLLGNSDIASLLTGSSSGSGNSISVNTANSGETYVTGGNGGASSVTGGWSDSSGVTTLNTNVADGARAKYTNILGNGEDTVTIMVYMCGSDLESNSGMATMDLQEMTAASISDKVNLIVYTGGARQWANNVISNSVNQIYRVKDGGLERLVADAGSGAMSDPATLTSFIEWTKQNYPANRNELILWDHGGGSVSGYAYDEKNAGRGYMSLAQIKQALENGGVKFDFIGFDACLMAGVENALMLDKYADYLIASEETEPGIGWYYTNWLNKLSANTSMATIEIGQTIIDDFTDQCAKNTPGQKTTLSIVDLAELAHTVPSKLSLFSKSISQKITNKEYSQVAQARNNTREFARSTAIDQVDLTHLARNMGTDEGLVLAEAIKGAVKYNRTSSDMSNAYGVSIYFPYQRVSSVDSAVSTYSAIGMDEDYARAIQEFAHLETTGQIAAGGSSSSMSSLFDSLLGGSQGYSSSGYSGYNTGGGSISSLLQSFLGGRFEVVDGLSADNTKFMQGRDVSDDAAIEYIESNMLDPTHLQWTEGDEGEWLMVLDDDEWELINTADMNMFLNDGKGYIDLGLDNQFDFNENNDMVASDDKSWIGINGQTVAYYHTETEEYGSDNYTISGYVPALLNDKRVNLLIAFTNSNPAGYVAGAQYVYKDGETETVAKTVTEINEGDVIDFLCDYYTYENEYDDSYMLGERLTVAEDGLYVTKQDMSEEDIKITYLFKDIYNHEYWTPALPE